MAKEKESLEQGLARSASKKGLSGEARQRYIGGSITNMRKKGELPAKKKAPPKEPAKPQRSAHLQAMIDKAKREDETRKNKEAYLEKKRKERAEQDKKDYDRIGRERPTPASMSGHDRAVLKREGAKREAEYKRQREETERTRKDQKRQAQETKHDTLYSQGRKPLYVVYAAKNAGDALKEVESYKTMAAASKASERLRRSGYAHAEYKNEYKAR